MDKPKRSWWRIVRDGAVCSMFFLPLYPLFELLPPSPIGVGLTPLLSGALTLLALWGKDQAETLLKWGVSLPLSAGWFLLMRQTYFFVRLVNWIDPGYGRLSGGAGFALTVSLGLLGVAHVVALGGAVALSGVGNERIEKARRMLQGAVLPLLAVGVLAGMVYLLRVMPSWEDILQTVYG